MADENKQNDQQNAGQGAGDAGGKPQTFADFQSFIATQPPEIAALFEQEVSGLKGAYKATQDKAKEAAAQLRELAKSADPDTAKRLQAAADEKDAENKILKTQLDFTTTAVKLGCRAPDKAWAVAQATGLSATEMKADEDWAFLFGVAKPASANGGNGTGGTAPSANSMNDLIRGAAGRNG